MDKINYLEGDTPQGNLEVAFVAINRLIKEVNTIKELLKDHVELINIQEPYYGHKPKSD